MIYCINPECKNRLNPDKQDECKSCGTPLLIEGRYRLVKPLRELDPRHHTEIWEVDDRGIQKVLKVLKDNSPKLVELFETEVMVLQSLKHVGIPKVEIDGYFSVTPKDSTQELYCSVMEKIAGENLEDRVKNDGSISEKTAIAWLKEILEILAYLHENGLFHRDIKPSNIMLTPEGKLVLIDFGSVKEINNTYLAKLELSSSIAERTEIISLGYTPLEQINGKAIPQSDFYALGRTFVYLLTGKRPTQLSENPKQGKLNWKDNAPQVSGWFADLIDDMMALFPGNRPQTSRIILDRLSPGNGLLLIFSRLSKNQKYSLGFGLLVLISMISFRIVSPSIASFLNEKGYESYEKGQLFDAESYLRWAIRFDSSLNASRYNLGVICENRRNIDCARTQYELVMQDKSDPVTRDAAISNLSRLYIREQKEDKAIELLTKTLQNAEDKDVKSALHRNLGWAYFQQNRYQEAESHLQAAVKLSSDLASSYCLLAQVREVQGKKQGTLKLWQDCLDKAEQQNPDEAAWQLLARQRLKAK